MGVGLFLADFVVGWCRWVWLRRCASKSTRLLPAVTALEGGAIIRQSNDLDSGFAVSEAAGLECFATVSVALLATICCGLMVLS